MVDETQLPAKGSVWTYKGENYRIVRSEKVKVKDTGDANWHAGVFYESADDDNGLVFGRRLDDFTAKFTDTGMSDAD